MSNVTQLIRNVARDKSVQQAIVEKDYAISYLIAAIAATKGLGDRLVLKGGTALKKLYFPEYRFSEDLDFSTHELGPLEHADQLMESVIHRMSESLNQRGPFQVVFEPLVLKLPHPKGQIAYIVRVQFPGQRQPFCRLKVEITIDEPILLPVEIRPVFHGFDESFDVPVPVYSMAEIAVEKLRALLQSKVHLHERGWGASRVCRDYYDLWNLLQLPGVASPELIPLLKRKCAIRDVSYTSPQDFISEDLLAVAKAEWQQQLLPFAPDAPPVNDLLPRLQTLILSIWE